MKTDITTDELNERLQKQMSRLLVDADRLLSAFEGHPGIFPGALCALKILDESVYTMKALIAERERQESN